MALRNKIIARTAALGIAFASVAPVMAQDKAPATFSLEGQVYISQVEAQNDPAYSDGVILIGDSKFIPVVDTVALLEENGINAAIINSSNGQVGLLFDGDLMRTWSNDDYTNSIASVLRVVMELKAAQANQEPTHSHPIPNQD